MLVPNYRIICTLIAFALVPMLKAQHLAGYQFRVVNMVPAAQSSEHNFDSETNIAVDPASPQNIVATAFTGEPSGSTGVAPVYVSNDGGHNWSLNDIIPSNNGMTGDISISFGSTSHQFYAGILKGGDWLHCMVLGSNNVTSVMPTIWDRPSDQIDQPWMNASSANGNDHVFAGDNNWGANIDNHGDGKTGQIMVSNTATAGTGFTAVTAEHRTTADQDLPAIRTAIHNTGVVYGGYFRWVSGELPNIQSDVVVMRDDNFATSATPFQALTDPGDHLPGVKVVSNTALEIFGDSYLGHNRVGGGLSIAVQPSNAATVFIAWCDGPAATCRLHVRKSTNSGQTWSGDLLTVTAATNPALAINDAGMVAIAYQKLTGTGGAAKWETHFQTCAAGSASFTSDDILSVFSDNDLTTSNINPSLGDYMRIQAVANTFYGCFPASNFPSNSNFPLSVTYHRHANFTTNTLLGNDGTAVPVSVDPFFFSVSPEVLVWYNFCEFHPEVCHPIRYKRPWVIIGPCLACGWSWNINEINPELNLTELARGISPPYIHLIFEGAEAGDYQMQLLTDENNPVEQEINKMPGGYVISFRPPAKNYDLKTGIKGIKLLMQSKSKDVAEKEARLKIRVEASNYPFKEHLKYYSAKIGHAEKGQ